MPSEPRAIPDLDATDRRLVQLLKENGRATYTALAPEVGLSQAAARARVQRLLEERTIDINGRIDPAALGIGVFALALVQVRGPIDEAAKRAFAASEAVFVAQTTGRCDLLAELRCRDHVHLVRVLDQIRSVDIVAGVEAVVFLNYVKQDWSGSGNRSGEHPPLVGHSSRRSDGGDAATPADLDTTDMELLRALMTDGRATYAELSDVVGLSQAAVRERVLRLLDTVLTIQAAPGPGVSDGLHWSALLITTDGASDKVAEALAQEPEIPLVAAVSGPFSLVSECWGEDPGHLSDVLDRVRSTPGISSLETVRYLRILKQDFGGGVL